MRFLSLAIQLVAAGFFFIGLATGHFVTGSSSTDTAALLWLMVGGASASGLGFWYLRPLFNRCREANDARTRFP